jgi:hypothetical protein
MVHWQLADVDADQTTTPTPLQQPPANFANNFANNGGRQGAQGLADAGHLWLDTSIVSIKKVT